MEMIWICISTIFYSLKSYNLLIHYIDNWFLELLG